MIDEQTALDRATQQIDHIDFRTDDAEPNKVQCAVCGSPNVFRKLCSHCLADFQEIASAGAAVKMKYIVLGMRMQKTMFGDSCKEDDRGR